MRCSITSRAGQVLAYGHLLVKPQADGTLRLVLETDRGRVLEGGLIGEDGDMTAAGQVLAEQFFDNWGMSDLTLSIQWGAGDRNARPGLPALSADIETALL